MRVRMTIPEAEEAVSRALEDRDERFLELARPQIYGRPGSPYLRLLDHAGCALGDLEDHVRRNGLDATLERLARAGVFLTDGESKGRQEVVRGSLQFRVSSHAARRAAVSKQSGWISPVVVAGGIVTVRHPGHCADSGT